MSVSCWLSMAKTKTKKIKKVLERITSRSFVFANLHGCIQYVYLASAPGPVLRVDAIHSRGSDCRRRRAARHACGSICTGQMKSS